MRKLTRIEDGNDNPSDISLIKNKAIYILKDK